MKQSNYAREPQRRSLCSRAWELHLRSPCAATTEVCALEPLLLSKENPLQYETHALQLE